MEFTFTPPVIEPISDPILEPIVQSGNSEGLILAPILPEDISNEEVAAGSGDEHDDVENSEADINHSLSLHSGGGYGGSRTMPFIIVNQSFEKVAGFEFPILNRHGFRCKRGRLWEPTVLKEHFVGICEGEGLSGTIVCW